MMRSYRAARSGAAQAVISCMSATRLLDCVRQSSSSRVKSQLMTARIPVRSAAVDAKLRSTTKSISTSGHSSRNRDNRGPVWIRSPMRVTLMMSACFITPNLSSRSDIHPTSAPSDLPVTGCSLDHANGSVPQAVSAPPVGWEERFAGSMRQMEMNQRRLTPARLPGVPPKNRPDAIRAGDTDLGQQRRACGEHRYVRPTRAGEPAAAMATRCSGSRSQRVISPGRSIGRGHRGDFTLSEEIRHQRTAIRKLKRSAGGQFERARIHKIPVRIKPGPAPRMQVEVHGTCVKYFLTGVGIDPGAVALKHGGEIGRAAPFITP